MTRKLMQADLSTGVDEHPSAPSTRYSDIAVNDDGAIVVAYMSNLRVVANAAPCTSSGSTWTG